MIEKIEGKYTDKPQNNLRGDFEQNLEEANE